MKNSQSNTLLKYLLFAFFPLFLTQCCPDREVWLRYYGTQCADPWGTTQGDDEDIVAEAVLEYFWESGVDVLEIKVDFDIDFAEACEACSCNSGQFIEIKVDECLRDQAEDEGFTKF